jgi:hypothetical protein
MRFPPSSRTLITIVQLFLVASASAATAIFFAAARLNVFFSTNCADAFLGPILTRQIPIANARAILDIFSLLGVFEPPNLPRQVM